MQKRDHGEVTSNMLKESARELFNWIGQILKTNLLLGECFTHLVEFLKLVLSPSSVLKYNDLSCKCMYLSSKYTRVRVV